VRAGLRGLTTRGKSFLATAIAVALVALLLGEKDLLRLAVLLAALPLLAAWYVGRSRYKLACGRTLEPHRTAVGASARVVLRLQNLSGLPTGTLLLEDRLPYALGSRPRLVLERLGRHQASSVAYTVRAEVRGRYKVGPLVVRLIDPFGLCELTRAFPSVDHLTVIPQVVPLPTLRLTGEYSGAGESRARSVAVHGEDDTATREYRYGDDLRRVHWRSTARAGELMVRREEQPWDTRATLILDTRADAHRGEGPAASFEWAVSAVASAATHLQRNGYKLRLAADASASLDTSEDESDGPILDYLAEVRPQRQGDIADLIERIRQRSSGGLAGGGLTHGGLGHGGLLIAVFGLLTVAEAELLAGLRAANASCVALLIDSTTWLNLSTIEREEADRAQATAALALMRSGWRVVAVSHGDKLSALWPKLARGSQGFAWRAAMAETVTTSGVKEQA
jgi:uncharacterized protein (DUF58 family)